MQPPREFLVFRLWGPMAAWGEIAVGERRGSWGRPSRSGVLGLVAAALGIERSDADAHRRLEETLGFALRLEGPGRPLRDYHTAQSPSQKRGARWATRRDELSDPDNRNTILSERGYYAEMDALIVLWLRIEPARFPLAEIAARLDEPAFLLYLGRKACPIGRPPGPRVISAETLDAALRAYEAAFAEVDLALGLRPLRRAKAQGDGTLWLAEADAAALGLLDGDRLLQRTQRRDGIRDRARWLFDDRIEVQLAQERP